MEVKTAAKVRAEEERSSLDKIKERRKVLQEREEIGAKLQRKTDRERERWRREERGREM